MPRLPSTRHVFLGLASLGGGAAVYTTESNRRQRLRQRPCHPSLDKFDFVPWTLRYKQAVSSTNSIFTLEPPHKKAEEPSSLIHDQSCSNPYDELWRNGTWSVTIKQPQLQVAREYTPLPPFPPPFYVPVADGEKELVEGSEDGSGTGERPRTPGDKANDLRFLIRKDGETSAYIHRRPVGQGENSSIEIRGPDRALQRYGIGSGDVEEIVFLAGGTGVVPAMQLAHGLLARKEAAYGERIYSWLHAQSGDVSMSKGKHDMLRVDNRFASIPTDGDDPRISILWANRHREECQGGRSDSSLSLSQKEGSASSSWKSWFFAPSTGQSASPKPDSTTTSVDPESENTSTTNPIVLHLNALRRSFALVSALQAASSSSSPPTSNNPNDPSAPPIRVSATQTLETTSTNPSHPRFRLEVAYFVDSEGTFISKTQLQDVLSRPPLPQQPVDQQREEVGERKQKKKLIVISGPDGFVEHFAGPREVVGNRVVQGRVGGVLGELGREGILVGWEVVKL
ncbi:hypothetical protein B9Z65_1226 [Elsinoe australis]|uniref:FAD-binding FR-type domain-containing protein n=1 Tax=Elsinoe australis TaxID=40998 RepID=A0A2P7YPY4_9PEZI|nr:hypothetical protein B9Z65_1226 [Elsinoe australis]